MVDSAGEDAGYPK